MRTQLAGGQLVVQDSVANASTRNVTALSDEPVLVAGTPGGVADPTLTGPELAIFNPATRELAVIALLANKSMGLATGGYQYADNGPSKGPCKAVTVRPGDALKISCAGPGIGFTLNKPSQRTLALALRTGALEHCLLFGERIVKNVPAAGNRPGEFQATNAPAPSACFDAP